MYTLVWIVVGIGIPLIVASLIAHLVHLPQYTRRVAIVVFTVVIAAAGLVPLSKSFRPGIDLSGGTILVYQVQQPTPPGFDVGKMVSALYDRINPAGLMDVTTRNRQGTGGDHHPPSQAGGCRSLQANSHRRGSLEFRILANQRDHASTIAAAEETFPLPLSEGGKIRALWLPLASSAGPITGYGDIAFKSDAEHKTMVLAMEDDLDITGELLGEPNRPSTTWAGQPWAFISERKGPALWDSDR